MELIADIVGAQRWGGTVLLFVLGRRLNRFAERRKAPVGGRSSLPADDFHSDGVQQTASLCNNADNLTQRADTALKPESNGSAA
jgi:hypothetical protein